MLGSTIESLGKLIKSLDNGSNEAMKTAQDTIDNAAKGVYDELKKTTPYDTGGLVDSLTIKPTDTKNAYGKKIYYDGYDKKGQAYQKIANSINVGRMSYKGKRKRGRKNHEVIAGATPFMNIAQARLKGLDDKIIENINKNFNDKLK